MRIPVAELLARVSSAELTDWIAYEEIAGTLGPERDDILNAILCATIANANRDRKTRKATPKDFLPTWDQAPQTADQQLAMLRQLNAKHGGTSGKYTPR